MEGGNPLVLANTLGYFGDGIRGPVEQPGTRVSVRYEMCETE